MKRIEQARLADFTTFRLGGPCPVLFDCTSADEVQTVIGGLLNRGESYQLIGGGSNLLVADSGLTTAVVRFRGHALRTRRDGDSLWVEAGAELDDFARYAVEQGIEGFVCCSGIPGTVGGAIVGNAGAFGEQIADHLLSVTLLEKDGSVAEVPASELGFAYRSSSLPDRGAVVLAASFRARSGDEKALRERRAEILTLRAVKHPDWRTTPTAGSFFKNIEPTSKAGRRQAAGWFLEQAGAMGLRVGGAHPFEKHANIVVADPGATAWDVHALTDRMAALVLDRFGITLHREVKLLGDFRG